MNGRVTPTDRTPGVPEGCPALLADICLEVEQGLPGWQRLEPEWQALCSQMNNPRFFHQPAWFRSYLEALAPRPDAVSFCAVRDQGRLAGVFPLTPMRTLGTRGLQMPSHSHLPFSDGIVADDKRLPAYISTFFNGLRCRALGSWSFVHFPRLMGEAPVLSALRQCEFPLQQHCVGHCDSLPIEPYDQMFARWSSNHRSNMRRARKRMASLPDVRHTRATTQEELMRDYRTFLELEASGWKGAKGTAIGLDPRLDRFYRSLIANFGAQGECEIHTLWSGSQALAAQLLLRTRATLYQLKLAYHEGYSEYAPGNLLLERILQQCAEAGAIQCFNLVSDAPWHAKMRPHQEELWDVRLYPRSFRSRLLHLAHQLQHECRDFAFERIRPVYRRLRGKRRQH